MKNKKKIVLLVLVCLLLTGCTKTLQNKEGKPVKNEITGQNLTENILCKPTDKETIKMYEENGIDLDKLPHCTCKNDKEIVKVEVENEDGTTSIEEKEVDCKSFKLTSGGDQGLWTNVFVKPLAYVILFFGKLTKNYGLGLIITSLLIRILVYPLTRKTAMQSEYMKKAQPEMQRIEKKYADKDQKDQQVMMQKSQEMMMVYKKYNINPLSGCLLSFIQLPLFIAFLEAINRIPAIFEGKFLVYHLGTTPSIGIKSGNYWYIIIIAIVSLTTYFSFKATGADQTATSPEMKQQQKMMTNMFTVMIIVMSFFMSTALDIYWMTTNLFTIVQNLIVKRRLK